MAAGAALTPPGSPAVHVTPPDDPHWSEWLGGQRHDAYHLPGYLRFASEHQERGEPLAFMAEAGESRLFLPLIVRELPAALGGDGRLRDAASPRGYPGPLLHVDEGRSVEAFLDAAVPALRETMRARGLTSAFVRLHPLLGVPWQVLAKHGTVVDHGDSASADLTLSPPDLWRQTRSNHRRDIDRLRKSGHHVRIDEAWDRFDDFVAAYAQSMVRLRASPWWRVERAYFEGLRRALGEHLHLAVVEHDDQMLAGALLTEVDGIVEYHLAGTFDAHVAESPTKLLIHFARSWARERGNRILHLAGSRRRGDQLIRFKAGFAQRIEPVMTWRLVVDPPAYADLSAAWSSRQRRAPDHPGGYFPAYRKPLRGRG